MQLPLIASVRGRASRPQRLAVGVPLFGVSRRPRCLRQDAPCRQGREAWQAPRDAGAARPGTTRAGTAACWRHVDPTDQRAHRSQRRHPATPLAAGPPPCRPRHRATLARGRAMTLEQRVRLPAWRRYAACAGRGALFYATDPVSEAIAVAVCAGCGVRESASPRRSRTRPAASATAREQGLHRRPASCGLGSRFGSGTGRNRAFRWGTPWIFGALKNGVELVEEC